AIISSMQQDDGAGAGAKRSCKDSSLNVESAQKKAKSVGGIVSASSLVLQDSEQTDMASHSPLIQWILFQSNLADSSTPESRVPDIHSGISAFVEFVGEALTEVAAEEAYGNNIRKLCAFQNVDTIATGPDNHRQIDIAQTTTANPVPSHKNAIIVSVKQFAHEQHKAYRYLVHRTRNLYATQPNRQFAWGLTVCGTIVRACLFVYDKVLSSKDINVSTHDGRSVFVKLLVSWSMCKNRQLGYDPTIRYNSDLDNWEIDVYDSETQMTRVYVCESIRCNPHSTFGRHTRCFVAYEKPADSMSANNEDMPKVLIKDAWAQTLGPDGHVCDEVAYLREIRNTLADDHTLDNMYPRLHAGGVVDDTTQYILMHIDTNTQAKVPARVHKRLVISPVGEPIHDLKSIDELIVVVGDVMAAHSAIVKRCGLLHRDLSDNNIMFCRDDDGVKGMLIDFDNACRVTDVQNMEQPGCVGTLPFMSIGNLEHSKVKRTVLDDWESLLYILCWIGTFNINQADQDCGAVRDLLIQKWQTGSAADVATLKRQYMHEISYFVEYILDHIQKVQGYEELLKLLLHLHASLFNSHHVSPSARGCIIPRKFESYMVGIAQPEAPALSDTQFLDRDVDPAITDSFARRAEIAEALADELLEVTQKFRSEALDRIRNTK
ncbi:hypothetical protein GGH20_002790, partial [Coemansia sp. RSA 1937]